MALSQATIKAFPKAPAALEAGQAFINKLVEQYGKPFATATARAAQAKAILSLMHDLGAPKEEMDKMVNEADGFLTLQTVAYDLDITAVQKEADNLYRVLRSELKS